MAILKADDFSVGMSIIGMVETFSYETVSAGGDTVVKVKNVNFDHHGYIYRIIAIQLLYILVKVIWNSDGLCIGKKKLVDTRYRHFMRAAPELLKALGVEL